MVDQPPGADPSEWRSGGTSPASPNIRMALKSARWTTTASPGVRPQMKVTTQSSQVSVWRSVQVPQSIRSGSSRMSTIFHDGCDSPDCVAAWLDSESHLLRLEHSDGTLAEPLARIPTFRPPREGTR